MTFHQFCYPFLTIPGTIMKNFLSKNAFEASECCFKVMEYPCGTCPLSTFMASISACKLLIENRLFLHSQALGNDTRAIIVQDNSVATQQYKIHSSNNSEHTSISNVSEAPILTFKQPAGIVQASERPTNNISSCAGRLSNFSCGGGWKPLP